MALAISIVVASTSFTGFTGFAFAATVRAVAGTIHTFFIVSVVVCIIISSLAATLGLQQSLDVMVELRVLEVKKS
jgi:hypothetical protein